MAESWRLRGRAADDDGVNSFFHQRSVRNIRHVVESILGFPLTRSQLHHSLSGIYIFMYIGNLLCCFQGLKSLWISNKVLESARNCNCITFSIYFFILAQPDYNILDVNLPPEHIFETLNFLPFGRIPSPNIIFVTYSSETFNVMK